MIGPCSEISVIVTHLGCESVVYLDNHMQWLCRLYVFVLFCYCLLFVAFKERRIHLCNHHFGGRSWSIHGQCSLGSIATTTATWWRKRHASTCTLVASDATF